MCACVASVAGAYVVFVASVFCTHAVAETVILEISRECYPRPNILSKNHVPRLGCSHSFTELPRAFLLLEY